MGIQKYALFVKEKLRKNMLKLKEYPKVRDHCHFTGEYRGAAHGICNSNYSIPKRIPVVYHNGSNYDCHFIMTELAKELSDNLIV